MPGPTDTLLPEESSLLTEEKRQRLDQKMRRIRARITSPPCQRLHLRLVASHGVILDNAWLQLPPEESPETERRRFYALMLEKAEACGYKRGWASYRYREKYNEWPPRSWSHI